MMENLEEILPILHKKTLENKIEWTQSGSDMLKTSINEFIITLTDNGNDAWIEMALFDGFGQKIEEITRLRGQVHYDSLREIYSIADRRIRKVDESISKVKSLLEAL